MSHLRSRRRAQQLEDDHSEGEETESVADWASDVVDSSADEDSSSDDDSEDDESASESDNDDESQAAPDDNPPAQKDEEPVKTETNEEELTEREKQILERREYRRKLAEDPSFVPYVGQFWSHDDRYRQDGLRPESSAKPERRRQQQQQQQQQQPRNRRAPDELMDKKWSHDGFDWLMKMEEEDRQQRSNPRRPPRYQQQQQQQQRRRRRPSKDGANSNWQSFDPAKEQVSRPALKDTSKDKAIAEKDMSKGHNKAAKDHRANKQNDKENGNGLPSNNIKITNSNGWAEDKEGGGQEVKSEGKQGRGWDISQTAVGWETAPVDASQEDGWGSSTAGSKAEGWSSTADTKAGKGRQSSVDAGKANDGWSSISATNNSQVDDGWNSVDTSNGDKGWGASPTTKADEGWGASALKTKEEWGSIDAPKTDAGWNSTNENAANSWQTNGIPKEDSWRKPAKTDTVKADTAKADDALKNGASKADAPKDQQASSGWASWTKDRSQRKGRGYLSQKKPVEAPTPAVIDFETLENAPWGIATATESDAWSHTKFIEQDDKEDQESDVEIILEAEPKPKAVEERPMDEGSWRRRDDEAVMPQQPYYYPQAPMGSFVPMTPHAYGIPLQPVAMPPNAADASEEQPYAMPPPAFEANGMVYYGVDPSAMYNYYYYQQVPMMVPQGGEEAEDQGWGATASSPQYPEDHQTQQQQQQQQQQPTAGYPYYYPPSYDL